MIVSMCAGWGADRDGIADYAGYLSDELRRAGIDVRRVGLEIYKDRRPFYAGSAEKISGSDICHIQFNYPYFNGELPYRNRFIYFADRIKSPIVITAHEVRAGFDPASSGFRNAASKLVFNATLGLWDLWSRSMHRRIYGRPARIIVHTKDHERTVASLVKYPSKVALIPHGIPEIPISDRTAALDTAKKRLGLDGKTTLAIFGFIGLRKGYETAIEALAGLPKNFALIIAGGAMTGSDRDSSYVADLKKSISAKGLSGRVVITGYLKPGEISSVMASSDICLAPFISRSASGALSLCLGYRKSVIASDINVHREINERLACLELFSAGDAVDLAGKIMALASDKNRLKNLSDAAASYGELYSYKKMAARTADLYAQVLAEQRSGA